MWCGIKAAKNNMMGKYQVIVPMSPEFIGEDMMIRNQDVSGRVLTKWLDFEDAVTACVEFNNLYVKYH